MALATIATPTVRNLLVATHYNTESRGEYLHESRFYPRRTGLGFLWDHMDNLLPQHLIDSVRDLFMFDEDRIAHLAFQWAEENNWDYDVLVVNLADASLMKDNIRLPDRSPNRSEQGKSDPVGYISPARREDAEDAIVDALDGMGLLAPGSAKAVLEAVLKALKE